jgi:hypothetical protein
MQSSAEIPIDAIDDSSYKASLLTAFKSKSKYLELWQELKHTRQLEIKLDARIYKHHKQYSDSLGRLHKQDSYFAEFCQLEYGTQLYFYSKHDSIKHSMVIKLLSKDDYHKHLSSNARLSQSVKTISRFE